MRATLTLFIIFCSSLIFAQPYVIEHFAFDGDLKANGTMDVQERIDVLFNEERHGIFRKIPIHYETKGIATRDLFLSNISVTDATGNGQGTKFSNEGRYLSIRIGDKDTLLPAGTRMTYVIHYTADGMINFFDQSQDWEPNAELYWNLTGDEWDTEIDAVDFHIRFPQVQGAKGLRARIFYGPYGSTASQTLLKPATGSYEQATGTTVTLTDRDFTGQRREMMPAFNGLTAVLTLPEKTIAKPTFAQQATRLLLPNLGFTIPIWVLICMSLFWFLYGRDPGGGPMVVQFDPPDGIGGAELGTLLDEKVDQRDLAAGIISLAVKGHLKLIPKESGLIFKHRSADLELTDKADRSSLSPFEGKLLDKLGGCSQPIDESELRTHVAPYVSDLKKNLYDSLVDKGYYMTSPETARNLWGCGGFLAIIALGFAFTWMSPFKNPLPAIVGGVIGGIILVFFAQGMPKRTPAGSKALSLARGFEEFVRRARKDELEWMSQKHPDAALFESYLPHAVAMGLTVEWAQAFEGIVHEMPGWYGAPYGTPFSPIYFGNDMTAITQTMGAAAAVPPRSSGAGGGGSGFSSGGGFSGGGFGGGGGGSW